MPVFNNLNRYHVLGIGLVVIWGLVLLGVPMLLPKLVASWLTFLALFITPGYCLHSLISQRVNFDTIERLTIAYPFGIVVLSIPGTIALLLHLTLPQLVIGWMLMSGFVIAVWAVLTTIRLGQSNDTSDQDPAANNRVPWHPSDMGLLLILGIAYLAIAPTINMFKIDGDAYAVSSFAADALAGLPLNAREPLFGTDLGLGVRMIFNEALPMAYVWSWLSGIDPIPLAASASRSIIALWAIFALYVLGKAAIGGKIGRRAGLITAIIGLFILIANPFVRGDSVSQFFFERTNSDKFMVPMTLLPVVFALAMTYVRQGQFKVWLAAAIASFAVSTIHPLIAAMLALALGAFGGFHLLLGIRARAYQKSDVNIITLLDTNQGLRSYLKYWLQRLTNRHSAGLSKTALKRSFIVWGLIPIIMLLPIVQLVISRGEAPLARSYPTTMEGWPVGYRMIPALPFVHLQTLDLFGPLPELHTLQPSDAYESTNPILMWRYDVNLNRRRLIIFSLNQYISDPNLIWEIPYILALLMLPFLFKGIRSNIGAQFAVSTTLAVVFVMFNPVITPLIGSFVMPWILWRFIWLIPYALIIAMPLLRAINWASTKFPSLINNQMQGKRFELQGYAALTFVVMLGLVLSPRIVSNVQAFNMRSSVPVSFPAPLGLYDYLNERTRHGDHAMVLANQEVSVTIPSYVAKANIVAHRVPTTSEVFPADQQDIALQRLIDQDVFFNTPYLTEKSIEVLHRYDVRYVIVDSGSELDVQLRLAPQWFTWLLDNDSYSLYDVKQLPNVTQTIQGNTALAARQWDQAQKHYEVALTNTSDDPLALFGLAKISQNQGEFDIALSRLQQITTNLDIPHIHYQLGHIYSELGLHQKSIQALEYAQQAAPNIPLFHTSLGNACLNSGDEDCAANSYSTAVLNMNSPDEAARLIAEAGLWRDQQRMDQAIRLYEQAVDLQPSEFNHYVLESAYREEALYSSAEELVQTLRKDTPYSAEVLATEANLLATRLQYEDAIALYRKAIRLQLIQGQETTNLRIALGRILLEAGHVDEAEIEVNEVLHLQPYNPTGHGLQGDLYRQRQMFPEAIDAYQQAFRLDPTRIATYVDLNRELRLQGSPPDDLYALLQTAIGINPDEPILYIALGDQLLLNGDTQGAIEIYQLALNRFDNSQLPSELRRRSAGQNRAFIYARLARIYENLGELTTAMNYYQATVSAVPQTPWASVLLGNALSRRNEIANAEQTYRRVIDQHPSHVDAYIRLAELLYAQGESTAADDFAQQALTIALAQLDQQSPRNLSLNNNAAPPTDPVTTALQSGEAVTFVNFQPNSLDIATNVNLAPQFLQVESNVDSLLVLARLYQLQGEIDKAIALYDQRLNQALADDELPTTIAQYHKRLGDLYLSKNQPDQAIEAYQRAINLNGWWAEARQGLSEALSQQGNIKTALDHLQAMTNIAPGSLEVQIAMANALDQLGQTDQALAIYTEAATLNPGNAQATLALAQAWQNHRDWDKAAIYYQQTIANNAGITDPYIGLAELAMIQGRLDEAEAWLSQAIDIDQQSVNAYLRLGDLALERGDQVQAKQQYKQASTLPAALRGTNLTLIDNLLRLGETDVAETYINHLLARRANDAELLLRLSRIQYTQGHFTKAETTLADAIIHHPTNSRLVAEQAELAMTHGQLDRALAFIYRAISIQPGNVSYAVRASQILSAQGKLDQAVTVLQNAISHAPDPSNLYSAIAALQADLAESDVALQTLEQGIQNTGGSNTLLLGLADFYIARAEFDQAQQQIQMAIDQQPQDANAYIAQANLNLQRNDPNSAIVNYELARSLEPANMGVQLALAAAYAQAERTDDAATTYQQILLKEPQFEGAYIGLASLNQNLLNWEAAQAVYETGLKQLPNSGTLLTQYANFWITRSDDVGSDIDQASNLLATAIQLSPTAETLIAVAAQYQLLDNLDLAEQQLLQAKQISPGSTNVRLAVGDFYRDQGNLDAAEAEYQALVDLMPGQPTAYLRLGRLASLRGDLTTAQQYTDTATRVRSGLAP